MTNQITDVANYFSTTLTAAISDSTNTIPVDSIGDLASPCFIVINPDTPASREVILCDGTFGASSFVTSDRATKGALQGSFSPGVPIAHADGSPVSVTPLAQHVDDLNDRVGAHTHTGGTDGSAVTHADLSLLTADDHTLYIRKDGTRAFTGEVEGITPTASGSLATKGYVDAVDHGTLQGLADFTADHGTEHDAHDHSTALASASLDDLGNLTAVTKDLSVSKVTTAGGGSASDVVVDFGNSYTWYQDNTGPGSSGDRSWFATPDGGALYVGPRGGGQYLDHLEFRAEVIAASDASDTGSLPIYTGTNGDVTGTAPAIQGDNYYMKAGYANGTTSASGQLSVTFGGGAFPNGVVSVVATAVTDGTPTRHITVGTVTTSGATFTFYKTGDGTILASDAAGVHYFAVGF